MDAILTPGLFNGVGVVALLALLYWFLATGRLVTRREADALERRAVAGEARADAAESRNDALIAQNAELMEMARFGRSVFAALQEGAKNP